MSKIDFPALQLFSERCLSARAPSEIIQPLDAILQARGIRQWYIGNLAFVNEWRGFGFDHIPSEWRARYVDADHASHDPVFQHAVQGGGKTTWSQLKRQAELLDDKAGLSVFAEAAKFDLVDGLILPIQGSGDLPAAVSFGGEDIDLGEDAQASLYVIAALAYEGLRRVVDGFKPVPPYLTDQELRVLRWTAQGKSAEVIAVILGLSKHTIQEYHARIRHKYRVSTMIQVVVLAAFDGNLTYANVL